LGLRRTVEVRKRYKRQWHPGRFNPPDRNNVIASTHAKSERRQELTIRPPLRFTEVTTNAYIVDGVRTPIGSFTGSLSQVRADDLAAHVIAALMERHPAIDHESIVDVIMGCANQAGEDNRNVARMALLLAGLPTSVPGETVNRLCASGMNAVVNAARAASIGDGDLFIAGGVEHMTRAPYVLSKATQPFARNAELFDTSIGWRFVNPKMRDTYGIDAMGQTAENVAEQYGIEREDQDVFACSSQMKAATAKSKGRFDREIAPVTLPAEKKGKEAEIFKDDEFVRPNTTLEILAKLKPAFRTDGKGTVTAGNSSGINDGAAALLIASESAVENLGLQPLARIVASAAAGVEPRIMGMGPVPASRKALERAGLTLDQMNVIELNEAFAAQSLACLRELGIPDDDPRVNPNGGAIALGHPLGMSGARLLLTAAHELRETAGQYALCTMCIGVGQGMATIIERV
ncbi:MAG TPA: 3-oxoadipyl-CoA thiolase, partial [Gemmatimonadaceae bacterium]|nr:3-oxoadipyl-CoA thiolase [Gemmatimonadaceae bacterium]